MSTESPSIRFYSPSLELLGELDEYDSLQFSRAASRAGGFQFSFNYNLVDGYGARFADHARRSNFVTVGTDLRRFGVILEVELSQGGKGKGSQIVSITGAQASTLFSRRVVYPSAGQANFVLTAPAETVIKSLIDSQCGSSATAARKFAAMTLIPTTGKGISFPLSVRYGNLLEEISKILQASGLVLEVRMDSASRTMVVDVVAGVDRTAGQSLNDRFILSEDYDTVAASSLRDSEIVYKNVVVAAGQGAGTSRNVQTVFSGTEPTDIDRREVFQDMRDLSATAELLERATATLMEKAATLFVAATQLPYSQYKLGIDYDLGDMITLSSFGVSVDVQITEVKESWSRGKYSIACEFNRAYPELPSAMTSKTQELQNIINTTEISSQEAGTNGTTIKYSDGTMIQAYRISKTFSITNTTGSIYYTGVISLPNWDQPFVGVPVVTWSFERTNTFAWVDYIVNVSATSMGGMVFSSSASRASDDYYIGIIAIGRWK